MSVKKLLGAAMWQGLLLAMLTLLALLAVSSLMLQRGLLPESAAPSMVCAACAAAVFAGSRRAVRKGEGGPLPQAAAVAVCLYAALWLIALGGTPQFSIHGPAVTASVFGGALLAGLLGKSEGSARRESAARGRRVGLPPGKGGGDIK